MTGSSSFGLCPCARVCVRRAAHLADSPHTDVPPSGVAGRPVHHGAAVAVEEVLSSGDAVQLAGVLGCRRHQRSV